MTRTEWNALYRNVRDLFDPRGNKGAPTVDVNGSKFVVSRSGAKRIGGRGTLFNLFAMARSTEHIRMRRVLLINAREYRRKLESDRRRKAAFLATFQ